MADFKIPEGEKFFGFMVWVALIGAALILAIDYTMKRQLLSLAKELREGGLNEQPVSGRFAGPANSHGNIHSGNVPNVPDSHDAGMETANDVEHVPFPIRATDQPRESNGRFANKEIDDPGGNGDKEIRGTDKSVES